MVMQKNQSKSKPAIPRVMIRVILVDDEEDFLEETEEGLRYYENSTYGFEVIGTAQSAEEGLLLIEETAPDILIMDIKMPPGMDGIEAAKILGQSHPDIHVLIFSSYKDFSDMETIVKAGIRGYISKGSIKELIKGVISIYQGEPYFPQEIVASLFKKQFSKKEVPHLSLPLNISPREQEIILLHNQGMSRQEISDHLKISRSSVNTYFQRIQKKNGF
jgi:DNA-binding NarL/FixJ family response regulator